MEIRRRPPNPSVKVANLEYGIPHSESEPKNILEKIVWEKDKEVSLARERIPLHNLKSKIEDLPITKGFTKSLINSETIPAIIAEVKKASPSKGIIREDFDPIEISNAYEKSGATCLSVLTDKQFFQGGFEVLKEVRESVDLPLLCKDFIITPYQIYQARAAGADAVLFIASILSDKDLTYFNKVASSLGLDVLVEVHDKEELDRIINIGEFNLVGINNRDLKTFKTNLNTTILLAKEYKKILTEENITLVSESGFFSRDDLDKAYKCGAKAVLIGEALMREKDIGQALLKLIKR